MTSITVPVTSTENVLAITVTGDETISVAVNSTETIITVTVNTDSATRSSLGLAVTDSPEFANVQLTTLYGGEPAGALDDDSWTWLDATSKSVLSVLAKIIQKIYSWKDIVADVANKVDKIAGKGLSTNDLTNDHVTSITFATPRLAQTLTGAVLLDRCITQYNNLTLTGALELSVGAGPVVEGSAEGVIIGNGINTPALSGITLWATSASFDATSLKQNHFMVWKQGDGAYIAWTQKN